MSMERNELNRYGLLRGSFGGGDMAVGKAALRENISKRIRRHRRKVALQRSAVAACVSAVLFVVALPELVVSSKNEWVTLQVPMGKIDSLTLADGSRIVLNGGSSLNYPKRFRGAERMVELQGEGFFDIHSDPSHPFLVECDDIKIKVTGTKFNLKSYGVDRSIVAELISGSIQAIHTTTARVVNVVPGERVVYNRETKTFEKERFNTSELFDWMHDRYRFHDTPFVEVVKSLERGFGKTFIVECDALKRVRITANFVNVETLEEIMTVLEKATDIRYTISDDVITIQKIIL